MLLSNSNFGHESGLQKKTLHCLTQHVKNDNQKKHVLLDRNHMSDYDYITEQML